MPDRVIWGSKRTTAGATPFEAEVHRDPDSGIWWVQSDDLPGLATEATSLQHLIDHIMSLAPAIVRQNLGRNPGAGVLDGQADVFARFGG